MESKSCIDVFRFQLYAGVLSVPAAHVRLVPPGSPSHLIKKHRDKLFIAFRLLEIKKYWLLNLLVVKMFFQF